MNEQGKSTDDRPAQPFTVSSSQARITELLQVRAVAFDNKALTDKIDAALTVELGL